MNPLDLAAAIADDLEAALELPPHNTRLHTEPMLWTAEDAPWLAVWVAHADHGQGTTLDATGAIGGHTETFDVAVEWAVGDGDLEDDPGANTAQLGHPVHQLILGRLRTYAAGLPGGLEQADVTLRDTTYSSDVAAVWAARTTLVVAHWPAT